MRPVWTCPTSPFLSKYATGFWLIYYTYLFAYCHLKFIFCDGVITKWRVNGFWLSLSQLFFIYFNASFLSRLKERDAEMINHFLLGFYPIFCVKKWSKKISAFAASVFAFAFSCRFSSLICRCKLIQKMA